MLTIKKLSVTINNKKILNEIDFNFEKGKIYALMGPNGSGKSTLAMTIMGYPEYRTAPNSQIIFEKEHIIDWKPEKRAKKGLFLSFQNPLSLPGVNVYQLLKISLERTNPLTIKNQMIKFSKTLKINKELLQRSLNEGFSGGEKKKMELLQAAMINPKLAFFDEVDTGVDIDALKTMTNFLTNMKNLNKTFVIITHYNRILKYLKPDVVIIMKQGSIKKTGDHTLAKLIEKKGYENIN